MRIKPEGRDAKRHGGDPKIDQVWRPQGQRDIKQHDQRPHSQIYARTRKAREKDAEVNSCCCKTTTGCNVSSATEGQVTQDGVGINLRREDFEDR